MRMNKLELVSVLNDYQKEMDEDGVERDERLIYLNKAGILVDLAEQYCPDEIPEEEIERLYKTAKELGWGKWEKE